MCICLYKCANVLWDMQKEGTEKAKAMPKWHECLMIKNASLTGTNEENILYV